MADSRLCGLVNLGNRCYQNACIQALYHTPQLTQIARLHFTRQRRFRGSDMLDQWTKLISAMASPKSRVVNPRGFVEAVRLQAKADKSQEFTANRQSDIDEFLLFLLSAIHRCRARKVSMRITGNPENDMDRLANKCYSMLRREHAGEYSEVLSVFQGIQVSRTACASTGRLLSCHPESFIGLPLPVVGKQERSLLACLDEFCADADLSGPNAYEVKPGVKVAAKRGVRFWSLPHVLVLHLKRCTAPGQKTHALVTCPLTTIDLSSYVIGYGSGGYKYVLYAVCQHHGGAHGGHYTATVKPAGAESWYHCNDTGITPASPSQVVTPRSSTFFLRKIK